MEILSLYEKICELIKSSRPRREVAFMVVGLVVACIVFLLFPVFFEYAVVKDEVEKVIVVDSPESRQQKEKELALLEDIARNTAIIVSHSNEELGRGNVESSVDSELGTQFNIQNKPEEQYGDDSLLRHENPSLSTPFVQEITVFENDFFSFCGYQKFQARVVSGNGGFAKVRIQSEDRAIPDRTFRGYSKDVPVNEEVDFWQGCKAILTYSISPTTKRITITYVRREE